ncbi:M20/M25/M40 family metallo-hydrolase [Sulfidibacter corallicola]|uniref:Carboxypeptidase Q n=1 Tax=Sulfidibacter corallicola TaxID=2818388 RepID=A0A8A4TT72_SULCO|nr:M20/M25/M40 family metallo-hydrolase [Sulfidibacter corallicola]QTD52730.1 M20/M25/M40 family metallo-hydrolase [Sulfidibacter corallicola]
MKPTRFVFSVFLFLFAVQPFSFSADLFDAKTIAHAAKLRQAALEKNHAYDLVESLTVEVGPRPAGSEADRRAVAWAEAKLKKLGFDAVYTEEVPVTHWERGEEEAMITLPFPQKLHVTALGHSIGTPELGLEAEVVEVASLEALTQMPADKIRGKIVFINHPMEKSRDGSTYGKTVPGRVRGAVEAARLGAVGIIIRSVGTDSHRFAHTGMMRYQDDVARIPAAAISNPDADMLHLQFGYGVPVRLHMRLTCRLLGQQMSANVIGEIKGRDKPEEVVVIGAHLDSWDLGTGALDDGAGVGIVVAAAKVIKDGGKRPSRTIRVILFANEESGLEGAQAYVLRHRQELDRIIVGAESDFGADRVWRFSTRVQPDALPIMDEIAKVLAPLGIERGDNEAFGGPDMTPFRLSGVPVVSLIQDGTDYFDFHHTADDTLDKVDPEKLSQNVAAYVVFAYMAAEAPTHFGRIEMTPSSP